MKKIYINVKHNFVCTRYRTFLTLLSNVALLHFKRVFNPFAVQYEGDSVKPNGAVHFIY